MAQWVNNMPAVQETQEIWVRSLGQEDALEEEMASHSRIFAWEIPWTQELAGLQPMGSQESDHDLSTKQQQKYHKFQKEESFCRRIQCNYYLTQ